ncbi:MAG: type II secretion system minor pseudopilin GspJ [Kordiimonas sp.]
MKDFFQNDSGFSLVETLVATVIFAIVSAAGVMILSGYQDGRLGLAAADERMVELDTARSLIRADLQMAVIRPVRDELGGGAKGFEGGTFQTEGPLLQFVRNGDMGALMYGNRSALKRIRYRVENNALIREVYAQTDITPETSSRDIVLLSDVDKLDVRFETDGLWVDEWGSAVNGDSLPRLVEFRVEFTNGRDLTLMFQVGAAA